MESFNYVQLDENGYGVGISSLSGEVISENMIRISDYDTAHMRRKYNLKEKQWTDEYLEVIEEPIVVAKDDSSEIQALKEKMNNLEVLLQKIVDKI